MTTPRDLLSDKRQLMAVYARMGRTDDTAFLTASLSHWLRMVERLQDANKKLAQEIMDQVEAMEILRAESRELVGDE